MWLLSINFWTKNPLYFYHRHCYIIWLFLVGTSANENGVWLKPISFSNTQIFEYNSLRSFYTIGFHLRFHCHHHQNPKIIIGLHRQQMLLIYQMNMTIELLLMTQYHFRWVRTHDPNVRLAGMGGSIGEW